jgi:hypothetical protein
MVWGRAMLGATTNKKKEHARAYHGDCPKIKRCNISQHSATYHAWGHPGKLRNISQHSAPIP